MKNRKTDGKTACFKPFSAIFLVLLMIMVASFTVAETINELSGKTYDQIYFSGAGNITKQLSIYKFSTINSAKINITNTNSTNILFTSGDKGYNFTNDSFGNWLDHKYQILFATNLAFPSFNFVNYYMASGSGSALANGWSTNYYERPDCENGTIVYGTGNVRWKGGNYVCINLSSSDIVILEPLNNDTVQSVQEFIWFMNDAVAVNYSIFINNTLVSNETDNAIKINRTSDFQSVLNSALNDGACDCTGCEVDGNDCLINVTFSADTEGFVSYSGLFINLSDAIQPVIEINNPVGEKTTTQVEYNVSLIEPYPSECWFWVTRGASLEVANTTVNCSNATGFLYVSSVGTNYTFHFFANDTSGNANYTNSSFSTTTNAIIITPAMAGGGGGVPGDNIEGTEEKVNKCDFYRQPLYDAWKNFVETTTSENWFDNLILLWNAFWDVSLCDSASSIVPIS